MGNRQIRFIELLLTSGALRFGNFTTKSGRQSPYFFNSGHFDSGERLGLVALLYAELIAEKFGTKVDNLFGPAYKGIPLAVMTSFHLSRLLGRDISFTFNRKEAKDHGEGGSLIGRAYLGGEKVVVIEDVITGGTSIHEMLPRLKSLKADVIGVAVGVDRQEKGTTSQSALAEVRAQYGVESVALVTVHDVVEQLYNKIVLGKIWIDSDAHSRIVAYLEKHGAL